MARPHARLALLLVALALAAPVLALPAAAAPIRAAFYYAWFPGAWTQGGVYPYSVFRPSLGYFDSGSSLVARRHVRELLYGGFQAGIYSWWGTSLLGDYTAIRFPEYLRAAHGTRLKWAVYYEPEGYGDPSVDQIRSDLALIERVYASDPSYLRVGGKPVVFVYGGAGDGCATVARWHDANTLGFYVNLDAVWIDTEPVLAEGPPVDVAPDASAVAVDGPESATGTSDGQVVVRFADGATTAFFPYATHRGPVSVALGDFDGDGVPDVATAAEASPRIRVFTLRNGIPSPLASWFAFDPATSGRLALSFDAPGRLRVAGAQGTRVFGTIRDCPGQPDAWHEYSIPNGGEEAVGSQSFTIAPGFHRADQADDYLVRDRARWGRNVKDMAASGAAWQLVVSFDEWGEGTAVESADQWASATGHGYYLDVLHHVRTG